MQSAKRPGRAPDATFVVGPLGIMEKVDEGAVALLGYPREILVGMHGAELIPADARPPTAVSLDRMRRHELMLRKRGPR
jgi:PAS domain-containing protein